MKLTNLLHLFSITSSFAFIIKRDNSLNNFNDIDPAMLTPECITLSMNIANCVEGMDVDSTFKESCEKFQSDKCKSIFKQDLNACGEKYGVIYGSMFSILKFGCAKDENGDYCPQFNVFKGEKDDLTDSDFQNICKSKLCTEQTKEGYKELMEATVQLEKFNTTTPGLEAGMWGKLIDDLNENQCKNAGSVSDSTPTPSNDTSISPSGSTAVIDDDSSNASTIKVGYTLLAILALALNLL